VSKVRFQARTGLSHENSPEDYNLIRQLQIVEFDGEKWMPFAAQGGN
jgi:hypothetical protein